MFKMKRNILECVYSFCGCKCVESRTNREEFCLSVLLIVNFSPKVVD